MKKEEREREEFERKMQIAWTNEEIQKVRALWRLCEDDVKSVWRTARPKECQNKRLENELKEARKIPQIALVTLVWV